MLPYSKTKNNTYVLVGRKKCYNRKDGYIQNNPGQFVIIGGGCRKDLPDIRKIMAAKREMREETGHLISSVDKIMLIKRKDYSYVFYKVSSPNEYSRLKSINHNNRDEKFVEINEIRWVPLDKALIMMDYKNKKNLPCSGKLEITIKQYIEDWSHNNWRVNERKIKPYFKKALNRNITPDEFNNIISNLRIKIEQSEFYDIFFNYWYHTFMKKSMVDWYLEMLLTLKNNINDIDKKLS